MYIDKTTLKDLSIIDGTNNIFQLINQCNTTAGSDALLQMIMKPNNNIQSVWNAQEHVKFWMQHLSEWPQNISNGTLIMIEKFLESPHYGIHLPSDLTLRFSALINNIINKEQNNYPRFAIQQIHELLKGCSVVLAIYKSQKSVPENAKQIIADFNNILDNPFLSKITTINPDKEPITTLQKYCYEIKRQHKHSIGILINTYAHLDALYAMARTTLQYNWQIPTMHPSEVQCLSITDLHHPLLQNPVANTINVHKSKSFIFLTGANMSGKSTFLRAVGIAALLGHIGMGVPARSCEMSFFHGLISNMKVEDNIHLGESYFFAEVQRMKLTAQKIAGQPYNLILMDEIFKGTNIHDAYECTLAVINGLLNRNNNLHLLSTHLYELHENLESIHGIQYYYFETTTDTQLDYTFTYQLKEGVSQDRIGYIVLKKQGVLDILYNQS